MSMFNYLKIIFNNLITIENPPPLRKRTLLLDVQLKYVQYIMVSRDTANTRMGRKDVIQVISGI